MVRRILTLGAVWLVAACATVPSSEPLAIDVPSVGYIVDGVSFATPEAVRALVIARKIREVRIHPQRDASYSHVAQLFAALSDLGLFFGIVGSVAP